MAEIAKAIVDLDGKEAGRQLDELRKKAKGVRDALKEADKAGDFKKVKKLKGELSLIQKEQRGIKQATKEVNIEMNKLNGMTFNQLKKAFRDLKKARDNAKPNTAEWKKYDSQLGMVRKRMVQVNGTMGRTNKLFNSFRMMLPALGIASGVTAIVAALKSAINVSKEFEKALSSLSAITGATGDNLDYLKEKAIELSGQTLQSATDIVKAYELIGSQRPELLKNKEALAEVTKQAIILSEATGGKLGLVDSAKSVTIVMNQMEQSIDSAASIINVLAAGSKEGSGDVLYLSEVFEKAGTSAMLMGMSVEELAGATEAIAPFYSKASLAGNSFDKVLLKLKEKQIGYTNGAFDLNDAIDELRKRYNEGETAAQIFGVEHAKLGELLVLNQDKFNEYTEAVTGTTVALEQQKTQNNNLAGSLTKLGNAWDTFILKLSGSSGILKEVVDIMTGFLNNEWLGEAGNKYDDMNAALETNTKLLEAAKKAKAETSKYDEEKLERLQREIDFYQAAVDRINNYNKAKEEEIKKTKKDDKTKKESIVTTQTLGIAIDKLKKQLTDFKEARLLLNAEDKVALDQNAQQIAMLESMISKMQELPKAFGDLEGATSITTMESLGLSDEQIELTLGNLELVKQGIIEFKEAVAPPEDEDEEDVGGVITSYLFGKEWGDMSMAEKIQAVGDMTINVLNDINQIISNAENQQMMNFKKNTSNKKKLLNKQLDNGIISYEEYTARISELDEELDTKKRKIAHDQAVRAKVLGIFQAVVNTAVGITSMLKDPGGVAGIILSVLAGLLGALQVGIIASEPVPQYAMGNYQNVIGAQDGKQYSAATGSGTGMYKQPTIIPGLGLVGEKDPELVFSGPDTQKIMNTPALIDAINQTISPQFAQGNNTEIIRETSQTFTDPALLDIMSQINDKLSEPATAVLVTDEDYHKTNDESKKEYDEFIEKVN